MEGKFTEKAQQVIRKAQHGAVALGHNYVGTEHILLGLSAVPDSVSAKAIESQGISETDITEKIEELIGISSGGGGLQGYTPRVKRILDRAVQEALSMGTGYVGTEHILIALLGESDCIAVKLLQSLGVNLQRLYEDIMNMLGEGEDSQGLSMGSRQAQGESSTPNLDKFSRDFTKMAQESKFDPIVGRDKEIERVIQILSRRTKNNPCLVGDPGVGKNSHCRRFGAKYCNGRCAGTS